MNSSLFLLLLAAFSIYPTEQQKCHTGEWNFCLFPVIFNARGAFMPRTNSTLTSSCKIWKTFWECTDRFLTKCTDDLHRIVIQQLLLREMEGNFKELCDPTSKLRIEFEKHLPCSSDALTLSIQTCTDNVENVVHMVTGSNETNRIHAFCCYFQRFYGCVKHNTEKLCEKGAMKSVNDYLKFFHFETIETGCSSYDPDSELCKEVLSREVPPANEDVSYLARFASRVLRSMQKE